MDEPQGALERSGSYVTRIASNPRIRTAAAGGRRLFGPVALVAVLVAAWSAREVLGQVLRDASPTTLMIALLLWTPVHAVPAAFDRVVLTGLGVEVRLGSLYDTYFARLPAKYLPGGVWHNVSRLSDLRAQGIPRRALTILAILQFSIPAGTALAVGGMLLSVSGSSFRPAAPIALAAILTLVATPFAVSAALGNATRAAIRPALAGGTVASVATWVFASLAFSFYLSAFSLNSSGALPGTAGAYLVGWGTGFISIFTPQGLGVFEASTAALLHTGSPFELMVAVVSGFRVIPLTSDVLAWAAHGFARRRSKATARR